MLRRFANILEAGAGFAVDNKFADETVFFQLFEVAVDRGNADGMPLIFQITADHRNIDMGSPVIIKTGKDLPALFRFIGHKLTSFQFDNRYHFNTTAGPRQ